MKASIARFTTISLAIVALFTALFAIVPYLRQEWYLYLLCEGDESERERAAMSLGKTMDPRIIPRVLAELEMLPPCVNLDGAELGSQIPQAEILVEIGPVGISELIRGLRHKGCNRCRFQNS